MDIQANAPKTQKLDHLPVIAQAMQRLRLREVIDEIVPRHPRNVVTTGQCIEGMITSILLGVHTLYRVDEVLEPFDLELAFGLDRAVSSRHFNDERLAKALDDLYGAGTSTIYTRFTIEAVRNYDLDLSRIHIDMTSVKLYGLYELSQEPVDAEDPQAIPHVARGVSKDHRPDLKQVVYGLAVSGDGPVPFFGRVASGNRADPKELRFHITQLAEVLPDPRNTILVGDTKLFCGKTLLLLKKYGFDYVTSVPRSFELWEVAYAAFDADYPMDGTAPVLKGKVNRWAIYERWRGQSYDLTYEYEEEEEEEVEGDDGKTKKVLHHIPVRALVVESSALRERKRPGLERRREKERTAIEKMQEKYAKTRYACREDAEKVAEKVFQRSWRFHHVETAVFSEQQAAKRSGPGRPKKSEKRKTKTVWWVQVQFEESPGAFTQALRRAGFFVLATNLPREGDRAHEDPAILEAYDEQHTVEGSIRWSKGPLAVAPVFLKTPKRIAALGVVYVLALMVYGLIQRQVRIRLAEEQTSMPGNKGWTTRPTTEVLFRLFEGVSTCRSHDLGSEVQVTGLNTEQVRILKLLRNDVLHRPGVRVASPRVPRPGERACKPRPRLARSSDSA